MSDVFKDYFSLDGKVAAVTGGGGVLCGAMCKAVARAGGAVAVLDLFEDNAAKVAKEITDAGGTAIAVKCDVLSRDSLQEAVEATTSKLGPVDILINGAGGNKKEATSTPDLKFFDMPADAIQWVFNLNCLGTIVPSQIFGQQMADRKSGTIINVSSMNAFRPLTRIAAYSAAKAAISNFTQWLSTHMAQEYSPNIRVNAIAPGFFLTEQNRFLLTEESSGELTARGQTIINHTPMGRFGAPEDLDSTLLWLLGPGAAFVSGIVVPVDGGFSAFSGV